MLIFEFENGSIINLLTFESLLDLGEGKYRLTCQSGTRYELTEGEFNTIKEIFREKVQES